jgi:hypothetical protein
MLGFPIERKVKFLKEVCLLVITKSTLTCDIKLLNPDVNVLFMRKLVRDCRPSLLVCDPIERKVPLFRALLACNHQIDSYL